ncbi:cyclase [Streptomyces sp. KR80]|uniref:cyclase n=1 Tax=Streptomyces sp. KR80 TaxID=3457426 RepID=UPI003FCFFFF0
MRNPHTSSAALAAGAAALTLLLTPTPAHAAVVSVTFDCEARPPIGGPRQSTQKSDVDATAPASAAPGSALDIRLATGDMAVPADVDGYKVKEIKDIKQHAAITGASINAAKLDGGSHPSSASVSDGKITVSIPGPVPGGSTLTPPVLTAGVTAGQSGSVVSKVAGTSYNDPGLTFTAVVSAGGLNHNVPVSCFPNPSPELTNTAIG